MNLGGFGFSKFNSFQRVLKGILQCPGASDRTSGGFKSTPWKVLKMTQEGSKGLQGLQ